MMKIKILTFLLITLNIIPCFAYASDRDSILFTVGSYNCLWRIYSDGNIEKLICFKDGPYGSSPKISPDQHYVVFIRENNLWLYEPNTKQSFQITWVGKPYTKKYASIEVFFDEWSWDSKKILYGVTHGETEDIDGFEIAEKVRPAKYGYYVYDINDKSKMFISAESIPSNFDNLVPNFHGSIIRHLPDGTILINSKKINRDLASIDISPDGRSIVAIDRGLGTGCGVPKQLIKIDLSNYKIIHLEPSPAKYVYVKFSPTGKHILSIWESGIDNGTSIRNITVDGKKIYTFPGISHFSWVNDNTIVFFSETFLNGKHEIIVIDSTTGKIKGNKIISEGKQTHVH